MKGFFIALGVFFVLGVIGTEVYLSVTLDRNCTGHLKRAADANSVDLAKKELSTAVGYLEANDLTKGYTSIVYNTPDEDIEFFYNNLKESQKELAKIDSTTTSLEKTNVLMKLRETLLDSNEKGTAITYPNGLAKYPHNLLWVILDILAGFIVLLIIAALKD